jgi:hypothetical protein
VYALYDPNANQLIKDSGPYGEQVAMWRTTDNDLGSDYDGGYEWSHWSPNTSYDTSKTYMYVQFLRLYRGSGDTQFYHGLKNGSYNNIYNIGGSANTNPYFNYGSTAILPDGVWCVSIGFLHRAGATVDDILNTGGVFRLDTRQRVFGMYGNDYQTATYTSGEYRMGYQNSSHETRAYQYYGSGTGTIIDFYGASVIEVNHTSPTPGDIVHGNYVVN